MIAIQARKRHFVYHRTVLTRNFGCSILYVNEKPVTVMENRLYCRFAGLPQVSVKCASWTMDIINVLLRLFQNFLVYISVRFGVKYLWAVFQQKDLWNKVMRVKVPSRWFFWGIVGAKSPVEYWIFIKRSTWRRLFWLATGKITSGLTLNL